MATVTVQHSAIADPNIHEPKGISTAGANEVYVANGAGSGEWKLLPEEALGLASGSLGQLVVSDGAGGITFRNIPHGRTSFVNITTPYTLTYPASYTKVAPTTTGSGDPAEVAEATNARLTYTGTEMQHFHIAITISASQSAGANRDIRFAVYKNGVLIPSSECIQTTVSGSKVSTAIHADEMMSTNDYIEVYAKNDGASGDVTVYGLYMFMMGMLKP